MSRASTVTFSARSSTSAARTRMPNWAPRPRPTITAVGVARPRAQGQAMTNTATAGIRPWPKLPVTSHQPTRASNARPMTAGTKMPEMRSASFWIGALDPCAASVSRTISINWVWLPTPSARMTNMPSRFCAPAMTRAPAVLATGRLSPVSRLSSTPERPSSTRPSTGMRSPARTWTRSPEWMSAMSASTNWPLRSTRALRGCRPISCSMAVDVRLLARTSSSLPRRTRVTTAALASK